MKKSNLFASLSVLTAVVLFYGCKASPAKKQSEFLGQQHKLYRDATVECWHKVWVDPDFKDWEHFKKIYIAPVNTKYLAEMGWWDKVNVSFNREAQMRKLAEYMRKEFIQAQKDNPNLNHKLQVVDIPDSETLIIQLAITEVVPTKVWLNTAGYALVWSGIDQGSIAMEGKAVDGKTGLVVAMFMDREKGRGSLVNVSDLTWYSHAKKIIDEWAQQGVKIINASENEVVEDSCPVTLLPW